MGLLLTPAAANPLDKIFDVRSTRLHTASSVFVIPDQFFGLELEIENIRGSIIEKAPPGWAIKTDGSLRGGASREYISDGPRAPGELIKDVDDLLAALILHGNTEARCSSFRTSMHVHMDFTRREDYKNMPYDSIHGVQSVALLYYLLEDQFFEISGQDRKRSGFCFPLDETLPLFARFLFDATTASVNGGRYYGMNFKSLARLGTLEFRHMPLSLNRNRVITWLDTLCRLKKWAYDHVRRDINPGNPDIIETPDVVANCLTYVFHHYPHVINTYSQEAVNKKAHKLDTALTSLEMGARAGALQGVLLSGEEPQQSTTVKARTKVNIRPQLGDEERARAARNMNRVMAEMAQRLREPRG